MTPARRMYSGSEDFQLATTVENPWRFENNDGFTMVNIQLSYVSI